MAWSAVGKRPFPSTADLDNRGWLTVRMQRG
jgi:hypothetical protein